MKVVKIANVSKESATSSLFTGTDVTRQPLGLDSKEFTENVVHLGKGVRNKFHTHDGR